MVMSQLIKKIFKKKEPIIPANAADIHCFSIKEKEVYIGFKIPNGNFHFVQIPLKY